MIPYITTAKLIYQSINILCIGLHSLIPHQSKCGVGSYILTTSQLLNLVYNFTYTMCLEVITWVKPYCTSYCTLLSLIALVQSPDSIIAQARSASAIMLSGDCTSAIRLKSVQYEVQYGVTHVIILLLLRHSLNVFFIVIKCFLYYYLMQL